MRKRHVAVAGMLSAAAGALAIACGSRSHGATSGDGGAPDPPLCVAGKSVDGVYPKRAYGFAIDKTLPDLTFDALDATGAPSTYALHQAFEPCAPRSHVLVVRVGAGWCGTCGWQLAHTAGLGGADLEGRLIVVDAVVANEDNVRARASDLAAYRARIDAPGVVVADPSFAFGAAMTKRAPLPFFVLVDTRTMKVLSTMNDPDPDTVATRLHQLVAQLDGTKTVFPDPAPRTDGFKPNEWDLLRAMKLPGAPPPDPTNAKADDPAAAALGKTLFSETALSPSNQVSCAMCHMAAMGFADGRPQGKGLASGDRNTPSVLFAAYAPWQFWDGRADSLWAQALGPFENPLEFGSSRLFVAHAIFDHYKAEYEAIFDTLPDLTDIDRFPPAGKPGDPAWTGMAPPDQAAVSRVFVNVGKAIAAHERTLRAQPNALDRYIGGDLTALTDEQKTGLHTFFTAGCAQCHYGPRLSDDAFHAVRFPTGRRDGAGDRGRTDGIAALLASEFRADGAFSDSPIAAHGLAGLTADDTTLGAFKTPPLRGVPATAPYGHGGTLATLLDVTQNYGKAGLDAGDSRAVGVSEPWLPTFTDAHAQELVPFLEVLTADPAL